MKVNVNRLRRRANHYAFYVDGSHKAIYLGDLEEAIRASICKADDCENEARYNSGYCGICDIKHNNSQGERVD